MNPSTLARRVFVLGATGTIGQATVRALARRGHEVVCLVRPRAGVAGSLAPDDSARLLQGAEVRFGDVSDPQSLLRDGFRGERFHAMVSCLASRSGAPKDAWAIDHLANCHALAAARQSGVSHVVLLSAICVQKPMLAFQHAKLAFEKVLIESGLNYSIVRPTAFFKSLSGQIERVRRGKPFLVFGDGSLTACKPISDDDLAEYLAECLEDDERRNRVLPIGVLGAAGHWWPMLSQKAELARIGRYYATESMLVLNTETGRYDAAATPSTGTQTLFDYYAALINGAAAPERGDHAVF